MNDRKQGSDSFSDFYYDILDLNLSRKKKLDDSELIEILRRNMDPEVRQRIFTYETKDKVKFFEKACEAYDDVMKSRKEKEAPKNYPKFQRRVQEIDYDELSGGEIEEIINKLNNAKLKRANLKCFNCGKEDHLLRKCPVPITRFFCFVCGLEGVVYPQCPDCLKRKGGADDVRKSHF